MHDTVYVPPQHLGTPYEFICEQLQKRLHTCERDVGYILSIDNVVIDGNTICINTGGGKYKVVYDIDTILPQVSDLFKSCIQLVLPEGVFSRYHNMPILVSSDYLLDTGWVFENGVFQRGEETLSQGKWVDVVIESFRFENREYQCLGRLSD